MGSCSCSKVLSLYYVPKSSLTLVTICYILAAKNLPKCILYCSVVRTALTLHKAQYLPQEFARVSSNLAQRSSPLGWWQPCPWRRTMRPWTPSSLWGSKRSQSSPRQGSAWLLFWRWTWIKRRKKKNEAKISNGNLVSGRYQVSQSCAFCAQRSRHPYLIKC